MQRPPQDPTYDAQVRIAGADVSPGIERPVHEPGSLLLARVAKQNGAIVSAHAGGACVQMMERRVGWRG